MDANEACIDICCAMILEMKPDWNNEQVSQLISRSFHLNRR